MAKEEKCAENCNVEDGMNIEDELDGQIQNDTDTMEERSLNDEISNLKNAISQKETEIAEYIGLTQRMKAEFDNYKKRVAKEKEQLYTEVKGDIILSMLPVIDNLERAVSSVSSDNTSIIDGVSLVIKQFKDILSKEGLEEIEALEKEFDPNLHNAVMHVEDESRGPNVVVEVFQKGYKLKDKIVRHSMVKVAN